jgi:hypothetical protein
MRKTVVIILFAMCFLHINAQIIVDTTKSWSTVIHRLPSYTIITESIKFGADTTIDFVNYKKVCRSTDESQNIWEDYGFIRETVDKKVYYRTDSTDEVLLYDFGLELNDIVEVYGIGSYGNTYSLSPMTFMLTQIDSVFLGGEHRKQFHLNPVSQYDTLQTPSDFWIEGIGSKSGILHWDAFLVGGDSFQLLCYFENDLQVYQNPSYTSCYYFWTGIDDKTFKENLRIYPNPMTNTSTIFIENHVPGKTYTLEIFDLLGRRVCEHNINDSVVINRNDFKSGLYVFKVNCNGETLITEKIMIK